MTDCHRCDRSFNSRSAYNQHVQDSNNHWECQDCQLDFGSWRGLKEHYVQSPHHPYCQYCNVHFNFPLGLQYHYEDEDAYCSSCNKVFKNDFGLHEHNRQKPKHADVYCNACRRLFRAPRDLRSHTLDLNHRLASPRQQEKVYRCPLSSCQTHLVSLSGLCQYIEIERCGVMRFRDSDAMNNLFARVARITM